MKYWGWIILVFLIQPVLACETRDDLGHIIKLKQPAQRIISLAPDLTEILFAAGAGTKVVGVMCGSDYPAQTKNIPVVADYDHVDLERLLQLHPDLIVVWAESAIPQQLKKLSIPVYISQQKELRDIPRTIKRMGCLAGTEKVAAKAAMEFQVKYSALQEQYQRQQPVTVFYQLWSQPLMTVSKQSWIDEVITLCGGKNIFADLHGVAPQVSMEAVIMQNPEVIIGDGAQWQPWKQMSAVKNHRIYNIDASLLERASPRILDGAKELCLYISSPLASEPRA